jgi:hypothetical protein
MKKSLINAMYRVCGLVIVNTFNTLPGISAPSSIDNSPTIALEKPPVLVRPDNIDEYLDQFPTRLKSNFDFKALFNNPPSEYFEDNNFFQVGDNLFIDKKAVLINNELVQHVLSQVKWLRENDKSFNSSITNSKIPIVISLSRDDGYNGKVEVLESNSKPYYSLSLEANIGKQCSIFSYVVDDNKEIEVNTFTFLQTLLIHEVDHIRQLEILNFQSSDLIPFPQNYFTPNLAEKSSVEAERSFQIKHGLPLITKYGGRIADKCVDPIQ